MLSERTELAMMSFCRPASSLPINRSNFLNLHGVIGFTNNSINDSILLIFSLEIFPVLLNTKCWFQDDFAIIYMHTYWRIHGHVDKLKFLYMHMYLRILSLVEKF